MTTDASTVAQLSSRVIQEVERAVVGKRSLLQEIMSAVLCSGHVLLEDYPGLAKTLIANSFGVARGAIPIQAHPIHTGPLARRYHGWLSLQSHREPLRAAARADFRQIILADEINRAPPKTQAAMLEAMQEIR